MNTVCVHEIRHGTAGVLPSYILVAHPEMRVHEDATRFISLAWRVGGSKSHQRNLAYSLSHWHTYCLAARIDYRQADVDQLETYRNAMLSVPSEKTGDLLSPGTVNQRLWAIARYYDNGKIAGWNRGALDSEVIRALECSERSPSADALCSYTATHACATQVPRGP